MNSEALKGAGIGMLFGLVLNHTGFTSWDRVHEMFSCEIFQLRITFCVAAPVLGLSWLVVNRLPKAPPNGPKRPMHAGTVWGGILFGAGWAVSSACPSIVFVQLGEGQLLAV
ncbi:MAG: YeeE/YedE family protein [Polyangiaceae bacterium]|nr:YeeE/YedE family protein [Polyangiaceae bacterium]